MELYDILNKKCNKLNHLIYLYGTDRYLSDITVKYLLSSDEIGFPELNVTRINDRNVTAEEAEKILMVPPIGGTKRLIIIDYECIQKQEYDRFSELIFKIPDFASLVLINVSDNPDSRSSLSKLLLKRADVIKCSFNTNGEITDYIVNLFKTNGKSITRNDAAFLYDFVQSDFNTLNNEIIKLCSLSKDSINSKDISIYCNKADDYKIYLLHNYLINGELTSAKALLSSVLRDGSLIPLISYLATNFEILLMARACLDSGYSAANTLKTIVDNFNGKYEYRIKNLIKQVRRFDISDIRKAIDTLAELDYLSKSNNYYLGESMLGYLCEIYKIK